MTFELKAITGTSNHVIVQRSGESHAATLVAEVVELSDGYTIYRMDVTGVLGSELDSPESALAYFEHWVLTTHPTLDGVSF